MAEVRPAAVQEAPAVVEWVVRPWAVAEWAVVLQGSTRGSETFPINSHAHRTSPQTVDQGCN